ncbi:MAG: hypothetical protein AAAB35_22100 [Phyllobacterium sp.]|uniref:hypothetical protein n=1 Tax=Phyllobacterium sp. TaxID=1871046 RepID=UPI0030F1EFD6
MVRVAHYAARPSGRFHRNRLGSWLRTLVVVPERDLAVGAKAYNVEDLLANIDADRGEGPWSYPWPLFRVGEGAN